jgi:TP901 family phage tail tape measure protein
MADKMRVWLELLGKSDGLMRALSNSGRAVHGFSAKARNELAAIGRAASSFHGKLAGLGVSLGAGMILKDSAKLDKSLAQIGNTAEVGKAKMQAMRSEFFQMGKETGQNIESLKDGFSTLIASGQSLDEAKESIKAINYGMADSGAQAQVLANGLTVAATAYEFDLSQPGKSLELLDKMYVAGKKGKAELQNLSDIFSRIGVNASMAGLKFEQSLAFVETLSLVEGQPERLATLADSTLRLFTNLNYMKDAQKATGVKFFDAKGERRDMVAVLDDMKKRYDKLQTDAQKMNFVHKAFGETDQDTRKGIMKLLEGDDLSKIREFTRQIEAAGGSIKKDLPSALDNAEDQAGRLKNTLMEAADKFAQPVNKALADLIQKGLNPKEQGGLGLTGEDLLLGGGAAAIGGTLAARLGANVLGGLAGKLLKEKGGTVTGVMEGMAWEKMAGVTPVFVTNWPGEMGQVKVPDKGTIENLKDLGKKLGGPVGGAGAGAAAGTGASPFLGTVAAGAAGIATVAALSNLGAQALSRSQASAFSTDSLEKMRSQQMVMGGGPESYQVKLIDEKLNARLDQKLAKIATEAMASRIGGFLRSDLMTGDSGGNHAVQALRGYRPQESVFDDGATGAMRDFLGKLQAAGEMADRIKAPLQRDLMTGGDSGDDQAVQAFAGTIARFAADIIRGDNELAQRIADIEHKVENNVTLNIRVDQSGRVTTETGDLNTKATVNVKRGEF